MRIISMYFSGTGNTKTVVRCFTDRLHNKLQSELEGADPEGEKLTREEIDFTPPGKREKTYAFCREDIVPVGVPVIAGRVPNVLLPFLNTLEGGGALAIPIVTYGNRNFDDALIELRNILEDRGFHTVAGGAFVGEHSFSRKLAKGRPDKRDLEITERFAGEVAEKIIRLRKSFSGDRKDVFWEALDRALTEQGPVAVEGEEPLRPYYKPRDRRGNHIDILKVKPKLRKERCTGCGICVGACPMGSISEDAPGIVSGICIKCCGCEKKCPEGALYFDDPGYIYHREELELEFAERKEPKLFL